MTIVKPNKHAGISHLDKSNLERIERSRLPAHLQ